MAYAKKQKNTSKVKEVYLSSEIGFGEDSFSIECFGVKGAKEQGENLLLRCGVAVLREN